MTAEASAYLVAERGGAVVATALLEAGLDRLPDGVESVALETLAETHRARRFYETRGFALVDTDTERVAGDPVEHAVYRRDVDDA